MVMHVSRVNRLLVLKEEVGKPALTYWGRMTAA